MFLMDIAPSSISSMFFKHPSVSFFQVPVILLALLTSVNVQAQQNIDKGYYRYLKLKAAGDSLYQAGQYRAAAMKYSLVNKVYMDGERINSPAAHYNAACAWSLAGIKDSAFAQLTILLEEKKYSNWEALKSDADFKNLRLDERWSFVAFKAQQNLRNRERLEERYTGETSTDMTVFFPLSEKVKKYVYNDKLPFASINHGHYRIFFRTNSYAAEQMEYLKSQIDAAYLRSIDLLGLDAYHRGINLLFVESEEEMMEVTGRTAHGGFAMAGHDCVVFNFNRQKVALPITHEIFHLISLQTWGTTHHRLLIEGSAVFAQNECDHLVSNPVHSITAFIASKDELFSCQQLITNFNKAALDNEVGAYFQSASIFQYLYENYGIAKMERLWRDGFDSFENVYGMGIGNFEEEWLAYIKTVDTPDEVIASQILAQGCQELSSKK